MNYLITAAGNGSRFRKEGIKPPKPLIKVLGNELLIWSLNSFSFKNEDNLFIITIKKHRVKERLEKKLNKLFSNINIYWLELNEISDGQLCTVQKEISFFDLKGPIIIHNCDTSFNFEIDEINKLLKENDIFGIIPCFKGEGSHWSFAKESIENNSDAIEVREKVKISNNCSVGTYIFKSAEELMTLCDGYFLETKINDSEIFIAPIYQYAIEQKRKVKITYAKKVKLFGTPGELLKTFQISNYELMGENGWTGNQIETFVVDIDKTICEKSADNLYQNALPKEEFCNGLRKAHKAGIYIILFTSRNMRSFKGSIGLINKITAPIIIKWLAENEIPYDELYFGKPWGEEVAYIDDKNITIESFLKRFIDK